MIETAASTCEPSAALKVPGRLSGLIARVKSALQGEGDRAADGRKALLAFAVRVASAGILFVSQIALARWMGAEQFGIYVYAWTLVLVLGSIATAGLNIGSIRIVSELREKGALDQLRGFLLCSRIGVFLFSTALALLAVGLAIFLQRRNVSGPWIVIALIMLALPAYSLTDLQDGICRGCGRMASALLAPYIVRPLLILCAIGGLHLGGLPLNASLAAGTAVAATWLAWAFQTVLVRRDLAAVVPSGARAYDTRIWAATAGPLMMMGLFDLAMQNIDVIVISNLLSPTDAGIYFAGAKTMALILFVHYAVGSAVSNRFAALATRGDRDALHAVVRDAVRWTFWPSLVLTVVMLLLGRHLLALFGPRFVDGYEVMCILAVAIVARAAIGPVEALLNMTGGQKACARSLMYAALTNLALSVMLTPMLGIEGAAISVSAAILLGAYLNWRAVRRTLNIDPGVGADKVARRSEVRRPNGYALDTCLRPPAHDAVTGHPQNWK